MKGLFVQTYGCQMNLSDSDRMKAVLKPLGFETVASPATADLVLINTCSVREKAENKTSSFAYDLKKLKKERPELKIGITGCVAQQEKEKLSQELPFVDLIIGPDNIDELPWILEEIDRDPKWPIVRTDFDKSDPRVWKTENKILNPGPSTFLSVMKGCDHFCSYCIVPMTRGREKSRPIADLLADVQDLVARGVKEVTFLGQNINTFGKRAGESLEELFYRAAEIKDLKRIRFTTSHPGDLKDGLIQCFKDIPKLCSNFHLPVQSGSNRVLRDMRRFYTIEQYLEKAQALLAVRPDIAFSTDIIVGFPGETEEDFQRTLELIETMQYDNVYSFVYSKRPGTAAATREDLMPEAAKFARLSRLQTVARAVSKARHLREKEKWREILIEGPSKKDPTRLTGRTSQNIPVHVNISEGFKVGDLVSVYIYDAELTHLMGSRSPEAAALITSAAPAPRLPQRPHFASSVPSPR